MLLNPSLGRTSALNGTKPISTRVLVVALWNGYYRARQRLVTSLTPRKLVDVVHYPIHLHGELVVLHLGVYSAFNEVPLLLGQFFGEVSWIRLYDASYFLYNCVSHIQYLDYCLWSEVGWS